MDLGQRKDVATAEVAVRIAETVDHFQPALVFPDKEGRPRAIIHSEEVAYVLRDGSLFRSQDGRRPQGGQKHSCQERGQDFSGTGQNVPEQDMAMHQDCLLHLSASAKGGTEIRSRTSARELRIFRTSSLRAESMSA